MTTNRWIVKFILSWFWRHEIQNLEDVALKALMETVPCFCPNVWWLKGVPVTAWFADLLL